MTASLQEQGYDTGKVLYMALELSNKTWRAVPADPRSGRPPVGHSPTYSLLRRGTVG